MGFRTLTAITACAAVAGLTLAGSANASSSARNCQPARLGFAFGAKTVAMGQVTQVVNLTNKSASACTMRGFPGVNLVGQAFGKKNYAWPLERQTAKYSTVTLAPGKTAHFNLIYLTGVPGDGVNLAVHEIVVTPPNDYSHIVLRWNQSVLLQDGATHPGTFIGPVVPGR
jgi:hypothetical protein